jgi:very-short-patch-repair endonuclease
MQVVERQIARIAGRQDNVITCDQLHSAGLGRGAIAHRTSAGSMQQLHTNVYLLGAAPPTPMARARAAVLACGADAVASHRSAACLYGLLTDLGGDVDVTVPGRNPGQRRGIRRHRVARLPEQDIRTMRGMNITSVARTICDLAATESARDTEHAFQEALFREVVTDGSLKAVLDREPTRRGAPVIRSLIKDPRLTRSERERRLLRLIKAAQLPKPLTNVPIHGYKADIYWPQHHLILEFDGWQGHGHRLAFEKNRKRDQVLIANGLRVMRVTDRQLTHEPIAIVARIAQALRADM